MARSINNLREQLLKAGLVSKQDLERIEKAGQRPDRKRQRNGAAKRARRKDGTGEKAEPGQNGRPGTDGETESPAEAAPPKAKRRRRRKKKDSTENLRAQIVDLYTAELIQIDAGEVVFNYMVEGSQRVRRLEMTQDQHDALVSGATALVAVDADVQFALREARAPRAFGRRPRRVYSGGPATSSKAPEEADLGLMTRAAAETLRRLDKGLVLVMNRESQQEG